ncbi:MAG: maleate cis-trans isomerase [Actinomycetota bacterium]|nr:maleate cis-trans isomerase [Actinomycetota bacterium]MDQ2957847.1 maleate cis-trans isomerase [Actinomycetota bacterium]
MAPASVAVYANRVHFAAMQPGGVMAEKIPHAPVDAFTSPGEIDASVELLAAAPLDVLACAFTSSAYRLGPSGEEALLQRLARRTRGIPLTTTAVAIRKALQSLNIDDIGLVNPPWFDDELDRAGRDYFCAAGYGVRWHGPAGIRSNAPEVAPAELFAAILARQQTDQASAIVIAGNGLRAVGIIDRLEAELQVPVLTANQVLLWHAMHLVGHADPIYGYGELFTVRAEVLQ